MVCLPSYALCLCVLPQALTAQYVVEGKVFDLGNFEPVRLCNVYIVGTTLGAATDSLGHYRFEVERPGKYEMVFSHIAQSKSLHRNLVGSLGKLRKKNLF